MCTTMIFTKGACADGAMRVTHSDDDELSDQRVIYVPAADHPVGAMRAVIPGNAFAYPRIVSKARGPNYEMKDYPPTEVIGEIPQVSHTYAYFDSNYGIMNEHNLMFGECTNGAKYQPVYVSQAEARKTGKHCRLFYSAELSRVALERCTKARDAVVLMGKLIDTYGYFGTGETLLVADRDDAWVFEMCALEDEVYHSAWVAQQVPDGELFVAANEFRIRDLLQENKDKTQMWSEALEPGVKKLGLWPPKGDMTAKDKPVDWLKSVSDGEYAHPYYSLRRVWRVFDRANPDLGLSPWVRDSYTDAYPFSVPPEHPLHRREIFSLYRDHYEGTDFDLTKGIAAGPYGDPHRFTGPYDGAQNDISHETLYGAWERDISVFYQGYSYVCEVRPDAPELTQGICWFGPDVAYTTCYVPLPAKMSDLPKAYQTGDPQLFSQDSAWWAFDFVANWSRLNFQRMCKADILPLQARLEDESEQMLQIWDTEVRDVASLTALAGQRATEVMQCWQALGARLIAKYSDGYINGVPAKPVNTAVKPIGYSSKWLGHTNYAAGPTSYAMKL